MRGGGGCTGCQGSCETFERKVTIVFLCSLSFEVAVYGTGLFFLAYPKITFRFWLSPLDRNFKFRLQIKFKNWNFKSWVQSLQSTFRFYKIIIQNQRGCLLYIQIWSKSLNAKFSKSTLGLCWSRWIIIRRKTQNCTKLPKTFIFAEFNVYHLNI